MEIYFLDSLVWFLNSCQNTQMALRCPTWMLVAYFHWNVHHSKVLLLAFLGELTFDFSLQHSPLFLSNFSIALVSTCQLPLGMRPALLLLLLPSLHPLLLSSLWSLFHKGTWKGLRWPGSAKEALSYTNKHRRGCREQSQTWQTVIQQGREASTVPLVTCQFLPIYSTGR